MISVTTILSYNNKITAQGKAMDYRWLDALHIMAGVIWLGGIFMMAAIVAAWSQSRSAVAKGESNPLLEYVCRWNRFVTSPAMILLWALGIALMLKGDWLLPLWLGIKLAVLVFLSAVHGILSGSLRRLATGETTTVSLLARNAAWLTLVAVIVVVALAVVKPFSG